ncbi:juvenile hormone epoxide hydrolase 1-like [Condylostylus longicornis]|uniref:juvenile hormone epoxide hydrolase 1-like n=1 Tax=Condylostylus longicornis TaxID=2530218 RepID=UPI00244E1A61|nr:juvenile hormone epoxide hydrolase 1-like [Condylostylus longicornis]
MGVCLKLFGIILIAFIAIIYQGYVYISKPLDVPTFDLNEFWGPGSKLEYKEDPTIVSNKIHYPDEVIEDLRKQLNRTWIYHDPLENVGFEYGFNTNKLKDVIKYWRDDYLPRWRERESFLWSLPHLTTEIQGLRIHFIQTKVDAATKKSKKVFPLLLIHGWPGSVREFYELIPKLSDKNEDYVFEVVAPSLPGYGWSQAASKKGLGPAKMAIIFRNLMLRLGYNEFFIQGGDWGSIIGSHIATIFPKNVLGYHSNMCVANSPLAMIKGFIASFIPSTYVEKAYEDFYFPLKGNFFKLIEESGYFHIQSTKPDTIGTALTDNPIGLAAYILEKFSTWTNINYRKLKDGGLEKDFHMDALLDNIMIYYLTNSITTSQRLYAEGITETLNTEMGRVPANPPTGCARFRYDLAHSLDWQLEEKFPNLIHSKHYPDGGHFIAMQKPEILHRDFIEFIRKSLEFHKKNKISAEKKVKA